MEGIPKNNADFPLETKACAEALQAVQKRTRIAFFLSLTISCIVVLMVLNLWESRQFRNTNLTPDTQQKLEYLKGYAQHVADNSFYQIAALGIQITCEDVGILGPLALFVFSLYSAITFKACYRHVKCAANELYEDSLLIRALLETERPLDKLEQPLGQIWKVFRQLDASIVSLFAFCCLPCCHFVRHIRTLVPSTPRRPIEGTYKSKSWHGHHAGWYRDGLHSRGPVFQLANLPILGGD
jgi:hypothetical protein